MKNMTWYEFLLYTNEEYDAVTVTDENGNVYEYGSLKEAGRDFDGELEVVDASEYDDEGENYTLEIVLAVPESDCEPDSYRSLGLCAANFH